MDDSDLSEERLGSEFFEVMEFDRSKKWANLLEKYKNTNDEEFYNLSELDEKLGDKTVDSDASSDSEMAEEIDILDDHLDFKNVTSRGNLTISENIKIANAHGILKQIQTSTENVVSSDVRDLLEETLPIMEEHKRNWREAGLERILNTFNLHKIEEKVGDWLKRNNSTFCADISPLAKNNPLNGEHCYNETDSDSLHSIDTARYIRSSKKHLNVRKRYSTTMTTIKSYRLVESKRNELRKKYEYLTTDDTKKLLHAARGGNQQVNKLRRKQYEFEPLPYGGGIENKRLAHESHRIRKKRYRRVCRNLNSSFSTSDEEDLFDQHNSMESRTCAKSLHHKAYCCHKNRKAFSRTLCCSTTRHQPCTPSYSDLKYGRSFQHCSKRSDNCLFLRESECSCKESDKLCDYVRHLANSSSEDWLVENCDTSEEFIQHEEEVKKVYPNEKQITFGNNLEINKNPLMKISNLKDKYKNAKYEEVEEEETDSSENYIPVRKIKPSKKSKVLPDEEEENKSKKKQVKPRVLKKPIKKQDKQDDLKMETDVDDEEAYLKELKAAIEASKETFAIENKNRNKSCKSQKSSTVQTRRDATKKITTTLSSNKKSSTKENKTERKGKRGVQMMPTISEIELMQNNNKLKEDTITKSSFSKPDFHSNSDSEDSKLSEETSKQKNNNNLKPLTNINKNNNNIVQSSSPLLEYRSTENTFLANDGGICNSTAFDKAAISRQIRTTNISLQNLTILSDGNSTVPKFSSLSSTPSTSSILKNKSSTIKSVSFSNHKAKEEKHSQRRCVVEKVNGCSLVSSTTDSGLSSLSTIQNNLQKISTGALNKQKQKQPQQQQTQILLYTPNNPSIVPRQSIINNRFRVTENHLASFIGDRMAMKFFKHYRQPLEFKLSSTVYYNPPESSVTDSSDGDLDVLCFELPYGNLREVVK